MSAYKNKKSTSVMFKILLSGFYCFYNHTVILLLLLDIAECGENVASVLSFWNLAKHLKRKQLFSKNKYFV